MGLGMILDSAAGMFPHKIGPLLQLLTALVSNKSTVKKVRFTYAQIHIQLEWPYVNCFTMYFYFSGTGVQLLG